MDIFAIIKDNLPEGIEVSDKAIKLVAKEISAVQGLEFVPKESYSKKTDLVDELQGKIKELETSAADAESYKTKHETLKDEFDTYKQAITDKEVQSAKRGLAKRALLENGVKEDILEDFMLDALDYETITVKDNEIDGGDKFIDAQKEKYGKYFGEVSEKGADINNPPANNNTKADPFLAGFNEND